jgi:hypothetical protein
VGRTSNCPVCDGNYYCRTSTLKEAFPRHTTSAAGSYSRLNCKCNPGYSCTYYKRIQAIVTLNSTAYDFNKYGGLEGVLEHLSPDTMRDESKPRKPLN